MPPLMRRRKWVRIRPWYYTERKPSWRAREKHAWRREVAAGFASLTLDPSPRLRRAREPRYD